MGVFGNLSTMTLPDLLKWAKSNTVSGVLELERNRIRRSVAFDLGEIVACSSDDPPARLGQMLFASGAISSDQLGDALAAHAKSGKYLGEVLVDMQVLTAEELSAQLDNKARETVCGLFEWPDGIFRFRDGDTLGCGQIDARMGVEDILLSGLKRLEELDRIRASWIVSMASALWVRCCCTPTRPNSPCSNSYATFTGNSISRLSMSCLSQRSHPLCWMSLSRLLTRS